MYVCSIWEVPLYRHSCLLVQPFPLQLDKSDNNNNNNNNNNMLNFDGVLSLCTMDTPDTGCGTDESPIDSNSSLRNDNTGLASDLLSSWSKFIGCNCPISYPETNSFGLGSSSPSAILFQQSRDDNLIFRTIY